MFKSIEFAVATTSTIETVKSLNPQYGLHRIEGGVAIHKTDSGHVIMVDKEWKIATVAIITALAALVFPVVYFFKK